MSLKNGRERKKEGRENGKEERKGEKKGGREETINIGSVFVGGWDSMRQK